MFESSLESERYKFKILSIFMAAKHKNPRHRQTVQSRQKITLIPNIQQLEFKQQPFPANALSAILIPSLNIMFKTQIHNKERSRK